MPFSKIIKNGTIVTGYDTFQADVGINGEIITTIGQNLESDDAQIIDAEGKYVFPGGVDVHTHLELPVCGTVSKDDFETGTIAAACGGTTSIIDFCMQDHGQSLDEALDIWHKKAAGKAVIDYGFHIGIVDMNDKVVEQMVHKMQSGYPSYKFYFAYDNLRVDDGVFLQALLLAKKHNGVICLHAENYYVIKYLVDKFAKEGKNEPIYHPLSRPPLAEAEATGRAVKLAMIADAPLYIVHLTCQESLQEVILGRAEGGKIMAETCPQYLLFSIDNYKAPNFEAAKYVMSPPLRDVQNHEVLWEALANNDLQVVSTDHCSFDMKGQKDMGRDFFGNIPNGVPGLECRMVMIYDRGVNGGHISVNRFVEITSTNPAKIFGMYPKKGAIAAGADADIVIFDPERRVTITHDLLHENVDYTPYEGFKVKGWPIMTISRGDIIVDDGKFIGKIGRGEFVERYNPQVL